MNRVISFALAALILLLKLNTQTLGRRCHKLMTRQSTMASKSRTNGLSFEKSQLLGFC